MAHLDIRQRDENAKIVDREIRLSSFFAIKTYPIMKGCIRYISFIFLNPKGGYYEEL